MIIDSHKRIHDYLRISLTDKCNLRCFYCMPEEHYEFTPSARLMQKDEIRQLAGLFVEEGVSKIRLTGGEPLVRKDAADIINLLSELPVELTLTTNGTRLHLFSEILRNAGINSVNISLDTLKKEKFNYLAQRDQFEQVMKNINLMIDRGFHVKLNVVVISDINVDEITDFVRWTKKVPVHVRFIEFMPFEGNRWTSNKVFSWQQILEVIGRDYQFQALENGKNDTAKKYKIPDHEGTFAVISTMSAPFCSTCNRMRLTADGKFKNCLFSKEEYDLLSTLRDGGDVLSLVHKSIGRKHRSLGGQLNKEYQKLNPSNISNRSMISIGG